MNSALARLGMVAIFLFSLETRTAGLAFSQQPADQKDNQRLIIGTIDPRVELMFAVQLLAGYEETGLISEFDTKYKRSVREHFGPFVDHAAVKFFKSRMYEGFNFASPLEFMLCHDSVIGMNPLRPYSDSVIKNIGGKEMAEKFRNSMRDFAKETNAEDFFQRQKPLFEPIVLRARKDLELEKMIKQIEEYTGQTLPQASIVFMPLGHQGGFGLHLSGVLGQDQAIALIGPTSIESEMPIFPNDNSNKLLIWHELAHPIVNPHLDRVGDEINRSESAFRSVQKRLKGEACGDWPACVKESVVRALVIRLAELHLDPKAALAQRVADRHRGWVYVDELLPDFVQFEKQKKRTPFSQLIPQIVARLSMIAESVSENP